MVDAAGLGLDLPAAERLLLEVLPRLCYDRRAGDEHGRGALGHHRIMADGEAGGAEAGDRTAGGAGPREGHPILPPVGGGGDGSASERGRGCENVGELVGDMTIT